MPDAAPSPERPSASRALAAAAGLADAWLCAALTLWLECLIVAVWARGELVAAYEHALAERTLVPLGAVAAVPVAVGGALLYAWASAPRSLAGRLALAVPLAALAVTVGAGVSGGRLLAGSRGPIFAAGLGLGAGALSWWAGPPAARLLGALRARGPAAVVLATAALVALLEIGNARLLVRLYPAMHAGLAVLTLWSAALFALGWRTGSRRAALVRVSVAGLALAYCAVRARAAPGELALRDNVRLVYLERAPLLGHAVRLAAWIVPPPPLEDAREPDPVVAGPGAPGAAFVGRDILLVTVDALRADRVGIYGHARGITPEIDRLGREGVVFEAAYTPTPHTSYALVSLMTGKYMRALLLQGTAEDSETLADVLRRYGHRTAAFYPPAAFFVDRERFAAFEERALGFEYRKIEFAPASARVEQLAAYLAEAPRDHRIFTWVHLFEPHEPYEPPAGFELGSSDVDRYEGEVRAADAGVGGLVRAMRAARPGAVVIVSADHGEEFGDHGGRYHGTTVFDEQVRVPLVVSAPGALAPRRVAEPVSLVDLAPTILGALGIPVGPRVRGRDLGGLCAGAGEGEGFAFSETDEQTLLARERWRLVCARRIGACRLFDVRSDPAQRRDLAATEVERVAQMKRILGGFVASLGHYERAANGTSWPPALRRAIAGDADAALDAAALLDDVDARIRRRAAEVAFELARPETAPALRRALGRDADDEVRRWCALGLTRMGEGAPLVRDLADEGEGPWRELAALALAEGGDARGERLLVGWLERAVATGGATGAPAGAALRPSFERARQIVAALARIKSRAAVPALGRLLGDVRLRPHAARALGAIGDPAARPVLAQALAIERYHDARVAMAHALVALGGAGELRAPLVRFLGVPDPFPEGVGLAEEAGMLRLVGGPDDRELGRLRRHATSGVVVGHLVPAAVVTGPSSGVRVIVRAHTTDDAEGEVRVGLPAALGALDRDREAPIPSRAPEMAVGTVVTLRFVPGGRSEERHAELPAAASGRVRAGERVDLVYYATQNVAVEAAVVVPVAPEIPPPPPEPWSP
jgi:arylsulfatase A-like enzyme